MKTQQFYEYDDYYCCADQLLIEVTWTWIYSFISTIPRFRKVAAGASVK